MGEKTPTVCRRTFSQITIPSSLGEGIPSWVLVPTSPAMGHKQGQWMPQELPGMGGVAKLL